MAFMKEVEKVLNYMIVFWGFIRRIMNILVICVVLFDEIVYLKW